jgi:ADP-L-glycero-D-manno-heptose 6-epimerase
MVSNKLKIITGAAGFIGSCLVAYLNEKNISNLILVDDLKRSIKWKNLLGKKFTDLISKHDLFSILEKKGDSIDAIVHLGACADTLEEDADYLLENNFRYTQNLSQLAIKNNIRFIYASSAATYGLGEVGFSDTLLDELRPINKYAFSKHLFDLYAKKEGLLSKIVGLKYFNVFGPNEYHKNHMASMINKMTLQALEGHPIELYKSTDPRFEDGGQRRDFVYVKDAVQMTTFFLENKISGIFNIGSGKATSWNEVAMALFSALKLKPSIKYIEMPRNLQCQYQNYTCADMTTFKKIYPNFNCWKIEEAVKDYVQNYLIKSDTW